MSTERLSPDQIAAAGLDDWRPMVRALRTRFATGDFATGMRLVQAIGQAAEAANHHPDLELRYPEVDVRLTSHDSGGITQRDVDLARRISQLASDLGVAADPAAATTLELALDTPDQGPIKAFWRAAMGYDDDRERDDEVIDGHGVQPSIWFQPSGSEEPRQRFHLDVYVPPEVVADRIAAAVSAGGRVVDEQPTFTVLADADGNRMCICH